MSDSPRRSILDSPWYWLYAFCAAGLVALLLMSPKYAARQTQLERNHQGRERANQAARGQTPDVPMTEDGRTVVRLQPLGMLLATAFLGSWFVVWRQVVKSRQRR